MHTKTEEKIVYSFFVIGVIAILYYNLKSGVSLDSIALILKDLMPLSITVWLFYIVEGMRKPANFEKPAKRAVEKIRRQYKSFFLESLTKTENQSGEKCLFLAKQKTSFISIDQLINGILEIRVSHGTLANFGYPISPNDPDKENRITNVAKIVKNVVRETLQRKGAKIQEIREKDRSIQIEFITPEEYEHIIVEVVEKVIGLLKEKREV
ncbi:MAG: hypothetical protein LBQ78_03780 [Tannerellaceae bacterium]|jgi:hypothetical protein|nr:hypothetical protein [Tannerellaceae bacterium]